MFTIVGLGNPGEEYKNTRHNTGKIIIDLIEKKADWQEAKAPKLLEYFWQKIGKEKVEFIKPLVFMNQSGKAVAHVKAKHPELKTKNIIVIYDDIDLPVGSMRISFNRGVGGHRGLESVAKALKSLEFIRIRVGIAPHTLSGKVKKPKGEKQVINFILGEFKESEMKELKKLAKKISEALETIVTEGLPKAMSLYN